MRATLNKRERMHKRIAARYCLKGLPRMRGDRPVVGLQRAAQGVATPHARGSTRYQAVDGDKVAGYPACAGIDPETRSGAKGKGRLPRMRGDRPGLTEPIERGIQATPHARGSTYC